MDDEIPIMKIIDENGITFFMEGADETEAEQSFGSDIEIHHGKWVPANQGE